MSWHPTLWRDALQWMGHQALLPHPQTKSPPRGHDALTLLVWMTRRKLRLEGELLHRTQSQTSWGAEVRGPPQRNGPEACRRTVSTLWVTEKSSTSHSLRENEGT